MIWGPGSVEPVKRSQGASGFAFKALLQRRNFTIAGIALDALDAMHWEKHDIRVDFVASANLPSKVIERVQINSAEASTRGREGQDRSPEFLPRHVQRDDYNVPGAEGIKHGCPARAIISREMLRAHRELLGSQHHQAAMLDRRNVLTLT